MRQEIVDVERTSCASSDYFPSFEEGQGRNGPRMFISMHHEVQRSSGPHCCCSIGHPNPQVKLIGVREGNHSDGRNRFEFPFLTQFYFLRKDLLSCLLLAFLETRLSVLNQNILWYSLRVSPEQLSHFKFLGPCPPINQLMGNVSIDPSLKILLFRKLHSRVNNKGEGFKLGTDQVRAFIFSTP